MKLLLNEKTVSTLGAAMIDATALKATVTAAIYNDYLAHCKGDANAESGLVALWEAVAKDKKTLATMRATFNRTTKKVHADLELPESTPAKKVKDSKLVDSNAKSASDKVGSEGNTVENNQVLAPNLELTSTLETLAHMLKTSKDANQKAALNYAIAKLAASL